MTEQERVEKWAARLGETADFMLDPPPNGVDLARWEACRIALLRFSRDLLETAKEMAKEPAK